MLPSIFLLQLWTLKTKVLSPVSWYCWKLVDNGPSAPKHVGDCIHVKSVFRRFLVGMMYMHSHHHEIDWLSNPDCPRVWGAEVVWVRSCALGGMGFIALQGQGFLSPHGPLHLLPVVFSAGKHLVRDTDRSVGVSAFDKNAWHCIFTPLYAFTELGLVSIAMFLKR